MSLDLSLNFPYFEIEMVAGGKNGIYVFDEFRLDAGNLMLYRGEAEILLPPKVVKTLAVLVENHGTILSKEALIERVWSDSVVEEQNLSQHLFHLRKTLGMRPDGGTYIETLRRRGYRFNAGLVRCGGSVNGEAAAISEPMSAARAGVERSGNVLRLTDWNATPERAARITAVIEPREIAQPARRTASVKIIAGIAVLSIIAAAAAFVSYKTAFEPSSPRSELSLLRLTNGTKPLDATIAPDGAYFVYHELADDGARLWLQQVGGSSRTEIAPPSRRIYGGKTFSSDGRFVYFVATDEAEGESSVYRIAAIGGPQVKILSGVNWPVSFSPDGREMVFIRENSQTGVSALVVTDSDGGNQRILLEREGLSKLAGSPAWSPDGSKIVFTIIDTQKTVVPGSFALVSIDASGGAIKHITEEKWDNIYRIAWTHDGRGLVMVATRAAEGYSTRRDQLYYISYPGGESRRLTFDGSRHQAWSLGVTKDDAIIATPFNRSSQIWSMDAGGDQTSAFQISHGLGDGRAGLAPVPNGKVGFIARSGDEIDIWLMNADGSDLEQVPSPLQVVDELRADPKGHFFVFSAFKEGNNRIFRCDLDGGNIEQLTFGYNEVDSTISPDGNWVVYESSVLNDNRWKPTLFKVAIDGGEPLLFSDSECSTPNYSPTGDLLSCIRGEEVVILSAVDGSLIKSHRLPPYASVNFGVRWTPNGRGLVYIHTEKLSSNLWVQPLDGGKPRPLTNFTGGEIHNYAFSIDGTRLFVARGYPIDDAVLIRNFR